MIQLMMVHCPSAWTCTPTIIGKGRTSTCTAAGWNVTLQVITLHWQFGILAQALTLLKTSTQLSVPYSEYSIPVDDTPITTDNGSNVVAALKNGVRIDCVCHRLHTVLQSAWKETREQVPKAAAYEVAISELCRFAKQSSGVQEELGAAKITQTWR